MTYHQPHPKIPRDNPGGATVASLSALDGAQALAVLLYRDWLDGADGQDRVRDVFVQNLDQGQAAIAIQGWGALIDELMRHARRPLMRHALSCPCVGADEAAFAQILSLAACGEREEVLLILSLLIRADRTLCALVAAESAGRAIHRSALALARARPVSASLH